MSDLFDSHEMLLLVTLIMKFIFGCVQFVHFDYITIMLKWKIILQEPWIGNRSFK